MKLTALIALYLWGVVSGMYLGFDLMDFYHGQKIERKGEFKYCNEQGDGA